MKNTMKLFWLLAAASVVLSCSKEAGQNLEATPGEEKTPAVITPATDGNLLTSFGVTFEGDVQDEETKVSVNLGTGVTAMEENDEVLVFVDGENNAIYKYDGEKFVLKEGETAVALGAPASVYYPASEFAKTTADFTMPAAIEASGDFGAINPMAGVISGEPGSYSVTLGNIASVLRVQVSADVNINSVSLNFGSGVTYAAGSTFSVDASTKAMTAKTASAETTETVALGTPGTAADVLFILPTLELSNGLTVTANLAANHNGGANSFSISKSSYTPDANKISSMSFYAGLFSGGAGTSVSPYLISNARDFKNIQKYTTGGYGSMTAASFLGAYYQQTADIDFKNVENAFAPIGISGAPFTGTYDGNSKKLENVNINVDGQFAAPFGYVNGDAVIKDLTVTGTITKTGTTDNSLAGGIAGIVNGNARISGCINQSTISSSATYTGGIAGRVYSADAVITGCTNEGSVSSSANNAGGIVGQLTNGGRIESCINSGNVNGASMIGGIVGYAGSLITNGNETSIVFIQSSRNEANITGTANCVGGIAGKLQNGVVMNACYAKGTAKTSTYDVGGLVGLIQLNNNHATSRVYVYDCLANMDVTTERASGACRTGGAVGNITTTSGQYVAIDNCGVLDVTITAGGTYIGGFAGWMTGNADNSNRARIRNCYTLVNSIPGSTQKGGFIGAVSNKAELRYCYYVADDSSDITTATQVSYLKKTASEIKLDATCTTFNGNDFYLTVGTEIHSQRGWSIPAGVDYPVPGALKDLGAEYYN